jgi:thiamine-phosphate diphosphorylase
MPTAAGSSLRLHVVTDDETLARDDFLRVAATVVEAGANLLALHVRGPHTSGRRIHEIARQLVANVETSGGTLLVNDRVDVAMAIGSIGVHLGRRSLPPGVVRGLLGDGLPIGVSCHSPESARAAASAGATYLLAGNVRASPSHPGAPGRGMPWLADMVAAADATPVAAIGGVRLSDVPDVRNAGATGVAVLRGIWKSPDPAAAVVEYIEGLNAGNERNEERK